MCKVTVSDDDGLYQTCLVSDESPSQILMHFRIDPEKKIVYLNGKILSKEKMEQPIPEIGFVHLAVKDKVIYPQTASKKLLSF